MSGDGDGEDSGGDGAAEQPSSSPGVKFFELEDAFEDDGENVVGAKFFGGNTVKEELYLPDEEERALELQNMEELSERRGVAEYERFGDPESFDDLGRKSAEALSLEINRILYGDEVGGDCPAWKEDPSMKWETPFSIRKKEGGGSPLTELAMSKSFYNKLDVAILSANTIKSQGRDSLVEVRWDIGVVWPNLWESRVLLTGTSILTIRTDEEDNCIVLLKQVDRLDGSDPNDIIGVLSSQLPPRFWDVYHIGMTPCAEINPRLDSPPSSARLSAKNSRGGKRSLFALYRLSYLPPRLVTEPSLVDVNGRDGRMAQAIPNHAFTTAIKTVGPNKKEFVPVSPVEITITKAEGTKGGSLIKWSVPVPPEFASRPVLPLPATEDEEDEDRGKSDEAVGVTARKFSSPYALGRSSSPPPDPPRDLSCEYRLRPSRFVATLPYAGSPQDEEVTQLRRRLYAEVVERDGFTAKLDSFTGRPKFFFWMNDAKACFTRAGGLGMAVYEWRAAWSKSNEIGIELEC